MKGSVLISCTTAGFLFLSLQASLILHANAQTNSTFLNGTEPTINSTSPSSNATDTQTQNGTTDADSEMVSCQIASCNSSECTSTFSSTNYTNCSSSEQNCELRRNGDATYAALCTSTCLKPCQNSSQNNCSINCCPSNCVNSTLSSFLNSSFISNTTTLSPMDATTMGNTIMTTTMATNGKKCNKLSCKGEKCFQGNTNIGLCAPGQNYCMLKKVQELTVIKWIADCVEDCSKETVCTSSKTNCILECCNATTTSSCLKLNNQVNVPGSGAITPCASISVMVSLFFLWLLIMGKSVD